MSNPDRALGVIRAAAYGTVPTMAFGLTLWAVKAAEHYMGHANTPLLPFLLYAVMTPHFVLSTERLATGITAALLAMLLAGHGWRSGYATELGVFCAALTAVGAGYAFARNAATSSERDVDRAGFGGVGVLSGLVFGGYAHTQGPLLAGPLVGIVLAILLLCRRMRPIPQETDEYRRS